MKKKGLILIIITLLLLSGCGKKITDQDLYGEWEGEILTHTQFRNSQIVERVYYDLYLYINKKTRTFIFSCFLCFFVRNISFLFILNSFL